MTSRTIALVGCLLATSTGCSDSTADDASGSGGGTTSVSTTGTSPTTSSSSSSSSVSSGGNEGGGGAGGGLPECSSTGLTPPSGPFQCGSVGCEAGSVCVESIAQAGPDGCVIHFCAAMPSDCVSDPSCACIASSLDYTTATPPSCVEKAEGLWLFGDDVPNPPWNPPACPGHTCASDEKCWGCLVDGPHGFWEQPDYQCHNGDPSNPGIMYCSERPVL